MISFYLCNQNITEMHRHLTIILFFILTSLSLSAQPKYEIRATWLTTLGGMDWPTTKANGKESIRRQKQELIDILDRLQAAHFNTVLFQVRVRGSVIYRSNIETWSECLTGHIGKDPGYDPLAFAIEECHKRNMELHGWFVTIPCGSDRQVRSLGNKSVARNHRFICKHYKGAWFLDPGKPMAKEYLSSLVTEVVRNYDIDGVHFDYIRYPENSKFPDNDTFKRLGKGKSLAQWRRDNITEIVRKLYKDVKAIKPWVKVSSSPVGKYQDLKRYSSHGWNALNAVYQDAQQWMREGIQDALFPMLYFKDNNFYPFVLDWKENSHGRWIVPGLGIYFLTEQNWPLEEIIRQVHFIRNAELDGEAYFRNKFLLDNTKQLLDEIQECIYVTPALIPPMTWIDDKAPSTPGNGSIKNQGNGLLLNWSASVDNSDQPVVYHLYGSNTYPVDINDVKNLIETNLKTTNYLYQPVQPWLQKRYLCVTAADRYGNESAPLELNKSDKNDLPILNTGDILTLPEETEVKYVSVTTATGIEVIRYVYEQTLDIQSIKKGFYMVHFIYDNGKDSLIGTILK